VKLLNLWARACGYFIAAAAAAAEPEARRLVGLVTVRFGTLGPGNTIGLTSFDGARYEVTIDIERLLRDHGVAALDAAVLHELGHVVDGAIVSDALDAKIPTGISCIPGQSTAVCAPIAERLADTFARWALNDVSVNGPVGYRILPPLHVAEWCRPLARLGMA